MSTFDIRRILVPTDFSRASHHAATYAVTLAQKLGARIDLLHVWEPPWIRLDAAPDPSESEVARYVERLEKDLSEVAERIPLPPDRLERHLLEGPPWRTIADFASSRGCDLVVMGTHGRSGLQRFLLGSVADRVLRASTVPVMVVPLER